MKAGQDSRPEAIQFHLPKLVAPATAQVKGEKSQVKWGTGSAQDKEEEEEEERKRISIWTQTH